MSGRGERTRSQTPADDRGFRPPTYPYDRLEQLRKQAEVHEGGPIDLSIGAPVDPPPSAALAALADDPPVRGYPPSEGTAALRQAAVEWLTRTTGVALDPDVELAACVGTKEAVVGLPHWLRLRRPDRDTVLFPALGYPSYEMGAQLARCRAVSVPPGPDGSLDLGAVDPADAARALCLWVNTPANPHGALDDLGAVAAWGRAHDVVVASDECYIEFTWQTPFGPNPVGRPGRTILEAGTDGVVALHSLSKRSSLAGLRAGFYAGDGEIVDFCRQVRKHAGLLVPAPVQQAAVAAWADDDHAARQREIYERRLGLMHAALIAAGLVVERPAGGIYLWVAAPGGDEWALLERLATEAGIVGSAGEFYGDPGRGHIRLAMVQPDDRLELAATRLERAAS